MKATSRCIRLKLAGSNDYRLRSFTRYWSTPSYSAVITLAVAGKLSGVLIDDKMNSPMKKVSFPMKMWKFYE